MFIFQSTRPGKTGAPLAQIIMILACPFKRYLASGFWQAAFVVTCKA